MTILEDYVISSFNLRFFSQIVAIERSSFQNPYSSDYLRLLTTWHPELFLVAVFDELVLGYVVASAKGKQGRIISLAVRPEYRKRGIGTDLLRRLLERLQSIGVVEVSLEVREDNLAAITVYDKLGFKLTGRIDRYYEDGCAALVFERSIP